MVRWGAILTIVCISVLGLSAQTVTWTDVSTALVNQLKTQSRNQTSGFPGASGVAVNRLNGDLYVKITEQGIWKSTNKGQTYVEVSQGTVTGRDEAGAAFTMDQDNPVRMCVFSLDGTAGFTANGTTWKKLADIGRNWDCGSVDWGTTDVKVMMVLGHESGGKVYKSTDAGTSWQQMNISVNAQGNNTTSMIGVMDPTNLVYSSGSGIKHSADGGATWQAASTKNSMTKFPVLFNGAHYVGTSTGLLKSTDKGATWQTLGTSTEIIQGPFFGADANTMVIVGSTGFFRTNNAGTTWTKIAPLKPNDNYYNFDPKWWGCYAWDPINNIVYASALNNPCWAAQLTPSGVKSGPRTQNSTLKGAARNHMIMTIGDHFILSNLPAKAKSVMIFDAKGHRIGGLTIGSDGSVSIDKREIGQQAIVVRIQ
jgi:hypothetical protein